MSTDLAHGLLTDGRDGPDATGAPVRGWLRRAAGSVSTGPGVRITGPVLLRGRGEVVIGDDVVLDAAGAPIELHAATGARITIGRGARLGPGSSVEAIESVSIGPGCHLGAYAKVLDNNWHATRGNRTATPQSSPVSIAAGARIGDRATLLPGAGLGEGARLLADSVLTRSVPAGVVVGGVPARRIAPDDPRAHAGPVAPGRPFALPVTDPAPVSRTSIQVLGWLERFEGAAAGTRLQPTAKKVVLGAAHLVARVGLRSADALGRSYDYGPVEVVNNGRLEIGDRTAFRAGPLRTRLSVDDGAVLRIGDDCGLNYGIVVHASESVQIGSRCLSGSRVLVADRLGDRTGPVTIEDDVWLAHGATIMPGVRVGRGSAVSAGSVVDRDVPPDHLAVGAPARFMPLSTVDRPAGPPSRAGRGLS